MTIRITIDMSDFETLADELIEELIADGEETLTDIYTELTAPPPVGTPVDTGEARNSWQLDIDDPQNMEIYTMSPYMQRLNDGHSKQTPAGFVEKAVQKHSDQI